MPETTLSKRAYKDFSAGVHASGRLVKAQLELTYRCNLRCAHCYTDPYNAPSYFPRELATAELTRIIDELAELGVLWLNLTGGEVFARRDFFELYEHAFDRGFLLVLYTNGTCFTGPVLERLKRRPPFFIDVSCHSVREEAFDRFTGARGSFRAFMKGMALLRASALPFRVKTKAMGWNAGELPEIRRFVEGLGLSFGFTTALKPRLDGDLSPLKLRLAPEEVRALETQERAWREDEESCREARAAVGEPGTALYRCGCATDTVHINAWGELGTCTNEYESRVSLRGRGVREAVEEVFSRVRSLRYRSDSPCSRCAIFAFCDKSPTAHRQETGDAERPVRYHCDVALDRAQRLTRQTLEHPLESRHPKGLSGPFGPGCSGACAPGVMEAT